MKSTGEVMGGSTSFGVAFAKAQLAVGQRLPGERHGVRQRQQRRQGEPAADRARSRGARVPPDRDARHRRVPARLRPRRRRRLQGQRRAAEHRRRDRQPQDRSRHQHAARPRVVLRRSRRPPRRDDARGAVHHDADRRRRRRQRDPRARASRASASARCRTTTQELPPAASSRRSNLSALRRRHHEGTKQHEAHEALVPEDLRGLRALRDFVMSRCPDICTRPRPCERSPRFPRSVCSPVPPSAFSLLTFPCRSRTPRCLRARASRCWRGVRRVRAVLTVAAARRVLRRRRALSASAWQQRAASIASRRVRGYRARRTRRGGGRRAGSVRWTTRRS